MKDPSTPVVLTNILLGFSKALDGAVSNSTVTSPLHTAFAEVPAKFQRFPLLLQGATVLKPAPGHWPILPASSPSAIVPWTTLLLCIHLILNISINKESIWNELKIPCNRKQNSMLLHAHLHSSVLRNSGVFTKLVLTRINEDTVQQHLEAC